MKLISLVFTLLLIQVAGAHAQSPSATPQPTPFTDPNPYQTQTWYRQNSGLIKTFSAAPGADAFQFEHPTALPDVVAAGSNFGIFKSKAGFMIGVVDALGRFYQYDRAVEPEAVGGVYYVKKGTRNLMVVDSDGAVMETALIAPAIRFYGGNYFIDQSGVLTTIKSMGMAKWNWAGMISIKEGLKVPAALLTGGNYFVDVEGKITTIASTTGFFSDPIPLPDGDGVKVYGGNYLITTQLKLFTVDQGGNLNFVRKLKELPVTRGYSYLIFKDQSFLVIKGDGSAFDKVTNVAMSGKPNQLFMMDGGQIQTGSLPQIGGVK